MIKPFHERMAELWMINLRKGLSEKEMDELYICLRANLEYVWDISQLKNLSLVASMTNDTKWQHEICLELDGDM